MPRHEHRHGAGERDGGAQRVTVDSVKRTTPHALEVMHERDAEHEVDNAFRERDEGPGAVLADSEKHAARRRLAPHQVGGKNQDDKNRITGGNILFADPDLDDRLSKPEKNSSDRQSGERTKAIARDKDFAQAVEIAGRFRLAGDGQKILRQRHDNLLPVVDDARADAEVSDRGGRDHGGDDDVIALELELRRNHDDERDTAVAHNGAERRAIHILKAEGDRTDAVGDHSPQHRNGERGRDRNSGDRNQSGATMDGEENQTKAREVAGDVGPVVDVKALEPVEISANHAERKADTDRGTDDQQQPARLVVEFRRDPKYLV